jgi:chromosome segregation ATPase
MSRAHKALVVTIVSALGLWGCAQGAGDATVQRTKALEEKVASLDEAFRAAVAERDDFRTKLEKEMAQLRLVIKERDDLRRQVETRTGERDAVQGQYDQFRQSLKNLLGQAETASRQTQPPTSTARWTP